GRGQQLQDRLAAGDRALVAFGLAARMRILEAAALRPAGGGPGSPLPRPRGVPGAARARLRQPARGGARPAPAAGVPCSLAARGGLTASRATSRAAARAALAWSF